MCGIAGWYLKRKLNKTEGKVFMAMMTKLFVATSSRGTDASGFSYINKYGELVTVKGPVASKDIIQDKKWTAIENDIPQSMIMHCRAATKGSPIENFNNHPITVNRQIAIVHNGVINNDDELKEHFTLPVKGIVDSEVIPTLVMKYYTEDDKKDSESMMKAINATSSLISGSYACAALNVNIPQHLFIFKHTNPTVIGYIKEFDALIFASTDTILYKCLDIPENDDVFLGFFKAYKWRFNYVNDLPNNVLVDISMNENDFEINTFTLTANSETYYKNYATNYSYVKPKITEPNIKKIKLEKKDLINASTETTTTTTTSSTVPALPAGTMSQQEFEDMSWS